MTSCVKLSGLLDIKLKISIQIPKTYTYCLFRVLSTPFEHQAKVTFKVRKLKVSVYNIEMYSVFYLLRENLYIYNLYIWNNIQKQFSRVVL